MRSRKIQIRGREIEKMWRAIIFEDDDGNMR